jgi:hypothetical protein
MPKINISVEPANRTIKGLSMSEIRNVLAESNHHSIHVKGVYGAALRWTLGALSGTRVYSSQGYAVALVPLLEFLDTHQLLCICIALSYQRPDLASLLLMSLKNEVLEELHEYLVIFVQMHKRYLSRL